MNWIREIWMSGRRGGKTTLSKQWLQPNVELRKLNSAGRFIQVVVTMPSLHSDLKGVFMVPVPRNKALMRFLDFDAY